MCGENKISFGVQALKLGSSPRVRGKLTLHSVKRRDDGLIPACAGKTVSNFDSACRVWAHPRVCGENELKTTRQRLSIGSSPRVRGKHLVPHPVDKPTGLIPACAGKTLIQAAVTFNRPAHPRVCGENEVERTSVTTALGSSPRVRGKPAACRGNPLHRGLIPACAGKTTLSIAGRRLTGAHPRVCGENLVIPSSET